MSWPATGAGPPGTTGCNVVCANAWALVIGRVLVHAEEVEVRPVPMDEERRRVVVGGDRKSADVEDVAQVPADVRRGSWRADVRAYRIKCSVELVHRVDVFDLVTPRIA